MRKQRFALRISEDERADLDYLVEHGGGLDASEVVRRLVRQAARDLRQAWADISTEMPSAPAAAAAGQLARDDCQAQASPGAGAGAPMVLQISEN